MHPLHPQALQLHPERFAKNSPRHCKPTKDRLPVILIIKTFIKRQFAPIKVSEERMYVQEQLAKRTTFCVDLWQATNLPLNIVLEVVTLLAHRMEWDTHNFIPSDPLMCLLQEKYDELASYEFFLDLKERFGFALTREEIEDVCVNGTIESLVQNLVSKIS